MCSSLIKTQEELTVLSKGSKQKLKEKLEQVREAPKDKRHVAGNRKSVSTGTSGAIASPSELDPDNLAEQLSQEKFIRWASGQPRETDAEAPH